MDTTHTHLTAARRHLTTTLFLKGHSLYRSNRYRLYESSSTTGTDKTPAGFHHGQPIVRLLSPLNEIAQVYTSLLSWDFGVYMQMIHLTQM